MNYTVDCTTACMYLLIYSSQEQLIYPWRCWHLQQHIEQSPSITNPHPRGRQREALVKHIGVLRSHLYTKQHWLNCLEGILIFCGHGLYIR